MRRANTALDVPGLVTLLLTLLPGVGCEQRPPAGGEPERAGSTDAQPTTAALGDAGDLHAVAVDGPVLDAGAEATRATAWDGSMPARPVPRTSPTVSASMPMQTQMQAVAYMTAMGQPRGDDPSADPAYAERLVAQLRPIALSLDKGSAEEKTKLDRVEIVGSGRRVDVYLAAGCDAETPMRAVVTRANVPLSTLRSHGVLVVRCNDARVQCLQSTRDPGDVLCTTAPRHR